MKMPFGKNIETRTYCHIISLTGLIEPDNRKGGDEEFLKSTMYKLMPSRESEIGSLFLK
jgi:hypothetical protein